MDPDGFGTEMDPEKNPAKNAGSKKANRGLFRLKTPSSAIPGAEFTVTVEHKLSDELGKQKFHITLKDADGERFDRMVKSATGTGQLSFNFKIPSDFDSDSVWVSGFVGENYSGNLLHLTEGPVEVARDENSNEFAQADPPIAIPDEEMPTKEMPIETETPEAEVAVSFDKTQLAHVRRDMDRAYRGLFRRETQVAKKSFESAKAVLGEKRTQGAQFPPEQQSMVDRIDEFEKLMSNVDGFWEQVHKSAETITGAAQIVVGSQRVGFVESKPDSVIIRRSGANIEYQYSFCPPGLAVAIAEQGAVKDVPTWNIHKAAFYTLDQLGGLDHGRRIDEFLKVAEDAGHDCEYIRRLGKLDFGSLGRPESKAEFPSKSELAAAVEAFRAQNDYKTARQLKGQKAYELAEQLFKSDAANAEQRIGLLEEARLLAIQAGAASLAEDAIYELDAVGEIEQAEVACETFTQICTKKLEPAQVRQLMERAIGYLNSNSAQSVKARSRAALKERLQKLAERYRMTDAARRLEQIEI